MNVYPRQGDPADAILDVAEERGADLIVVGNKGMTGAKRFLLGSVPEQGLPPRALLGADHPDDLTVDGRPRPLVVQYLYVHGPGEAFDYPFRVAHGRRRAAGGAIRACCAGRPLRLRGVECDLALVTNLTDRRSLGTHGASLLKEIESVGGRSRSPYYLHRPAGRWRRSRSSRYVFDAIVAVGDKGDSDRRLCLVDVDCIWLDAPRYLPPFPIAGHRLHSHPLPPRLGGSTVFHAGADPLGELRLRLA